MELPRFSSSFPGSDPAGLTGAARALALLGLDRPLIVVASTEEQARRLHTDLSFFAEARHRGVPVLLPPREDRLSAARLAALEGIAKSAPLVVTDREAARAPIWAPGLLRKAALAVRRGEDIEREFLVELLSEMGYRRVQIVADIGEFSNHSDQIDVFPTAARHPVRLVFTGEKISELRIFDVGTQRSFRETPGVEFLPVREPPAGPALFDMLPGHLVVEDPQPGSRPPGDREAEGQSSGFGLTARERQRAGKGLSALGPRLAAVSGEVTVLATAETKGEAERLRDLLAEAGVRVPILAPAEVSGAPGPLAIALGALSGGFFDPVSRFLLVTSPELFGARSTARAFRQSRVAPLISSLDDLQPGDSVVHLEHGVGRFLGIEKAAGADYDADFLKLEYAAGATVFVPVERIDLIRRHHAAGGAPPHLDTLGGASWRKAASRVKTKVRTMAVDLLRMQAEREAAPGFAFSPDGEPHREFAEAFAFEETPDQRASIEEIRRDMEAPRPMDRLLCGDPGYGKTEVAMRAVFKAVADRKQVAVIAPTTLLAEQHAATFAGRFAAFPARIETLTRFTSAAGAAEILQRIAGGQTDIVVGTHRLLSRDVAFADLGLIVVDEEQKFGVAHKERIRALRAGIDVLTLSATPIPRTLNLALTGLRPVSVIETPPEERLAVRSVVARFAAPLIREALEREFARGGQVFFVHNRIESIARLGVFLQRLAPGRRIGIAHARMPERALEEVMRGFHAGQIDLLLATSIVGAGLDIPRANTLIVDRADRFGLADLYQLKGRVGRSDVRAFAYFLVPHEDRLTLEAGRRLEALQELSYLGAGFRLALKDLEIRGAGDLLGGEQSGNIAAVGYDLYLEMLRDAVGELTGKTAIARPEPGLELRIPAHLPARWIDDATLRFTMLRKVAAARDEGAVADLRRELRDRFGPPPPEAGRLLDLAELKAVCRRIGVARIQEQTDRRYRVVFDDLAPLPAKALLALPRASGEAITFLPEGGFEIDLVKRSWEEIFPRLMRVLALASGEKNRES